MYVYASVRACMHVSVCVYVRTCMCVCVCVCVCAFELVTLVERGGSCIYTYLNFFFIYSYFIVLPKSRFNDEKLNQ